MSAACSLMPWGCRPVPRGRVLWFALVLTVWLMLGPLAPAAACPVRSRRSPRRSWHPLAPDEPVNN